MDIVLNVKLVVILNNVNTLDFRITNFKILTVIVYTRWFEWHYTQPWRVLKSIFRQYIKQILYYFGNFIQTFGERKFTKDSWRKYEYKIKYCILNFGKVWFGIKNGDSFILSITIHYTTRNWNSYRVESIPLAHETVRSEFVPIVFSGSNVPMRSFYHVIFTSL